MKRIPFETGCCYHIYNRGTEKRDIVADDADRARFVHFLYVANDRDPISKLQNLDDQNIRGLTSDILANLHKGRNREPLVDIIAWALMDNHFHASIRQRIDGGASKFLQKFGTGLTMYFNARHQRTGVLFQSTCKSKPIDSDAYLVRHIAYIHANPGELIRGNIEDKMAFLETYRWSSYFDYIGKKNFPSVIDTRTITEYMGTPKDHKVFVREALERKETEHDIRG